MLKKPTYEELELRIKELEGAAVERDCKEPALSAYVEKYNAVFHNSLDAIIIIDTKSGLILCANRTSHDILGYNSEDIIGKHFSALFPPETRMSDKDLLEKTRSYGPVFTQDFLCFDGSVCPMDITVTLVTWESNEVILATFRDIKERVAAERERERLIHELEEAIGKVEMLSGLLPICAGCKKIRDDEGYWNQVESYISERSDANFTHSICPECEKEFYPEFSRSRDNLKKIKGFT